jgi:signal peptidase I
LNLINEGAEDKAEPTQPTKKTGTSVFKFLFEILQTVILALILYFLIDSVVARVRVENISMLPTLESGEFLLVNKLAYRIGDYQHGDIIVFHYPKNPQDDYIKRIVGLPGDTVTVTQEKVYVNGTMMDEGYIAEPPGYDGEWIVPPDSVFVLGDNRNQSSDSHSWGFVPTDDIVGKAIVIYWPLDELKIINSPSIVNAANTQ